MKLAIILTTLLSLNFLNPTTTPENKPEGGIQFETGTWAEVMQKAKDENKLIFVDAFAKWCGPCKWMDKKVFTDPAVGDFYNKNFINYRFDMEVGEGRTFASKYVIRNYPTLLFLDGEGKIVHRTIGSRASEQFISLGQEALNKHQ
jgi:thiol:disulfide interchange protein